MKIGFKTFLVMLLLTAVSTILAVCFAPDSPEPCGEDCYLDTEELETADFLERQITHYYADYYGTSDSIAGMIWQEADRADVPREIAFNLVRVESAFRPDAVSWAGAYGLAQVKLSTARIFDEDITREELLGERTNLRLGFQYLSRLRLRFGSWERALAAYNAGPTRHVRAGRTGEYDGHAYARRVLR